LLRRPLRVAPAAQRMSKSHPGAPLPFDPSELGPAPEIVVEPVAAVDERFGPFGGKCVKLRHCLSEPECRFLIARMEAQLAPLEIDLDYRRNERAVFDSEALAALLWGRIKPIVEAFVVHVGASPEDQRLLGAEAGPCPAFLQLGYGFEGTWRPCGLNECLRFCRYEQGGFFRAHCDGSFERSSEEVSLFTCMLYLDGGLDGGETRFLEPDMPLDPDYARRPAPSARSLAAVAPEAGMCLVFFQPGLLHEGLDLRSGTKHLLRTDVLCRRDPESRPQQTASEREAWECVRAARLAESERDFPRACELYQRAFRLEPRLERVC